MAESIKHSNTVSSVQEWLVDGMTCNNCARHVQEALQGITGVAGATVNLNAASAKVRWQPGVVPDAPAIEQALVAVGFSAKLAPNKTSSSVPSAKASALAGWKLNVYLGSTATAILMTGEWGVGLGMTPWFQWLALALATPVQILCGARFYKGAWAQLKIGSSNMDTLVSLGSTTAFVYSVWGLFSGHAGHLYFMEAAAIITLISIGHWLEGMASAKAANALGSMMKLVPDKARRLSGMMSEVEVSVADLCLGDSVVLKPGDRVPVDGVVAFGASAVDEAMLTGESLPVEKGRGDKLYAGTLNVNSRLVMRVTATGEATALAHIMAVVERAQSSRAHIQRLGDRVSSVFVPIVCVTALLTALWWGLGFASATQVHNWLGQYLWTAMIPVTAAGAAVVHAVGVLIISCPCAMGLATPAAIMSGTNAAARRGILIRDGVALEKCGHLSAVVFDKTGTLTTGKVAVVKSLDCRPEGTRTMPLETLAANVAQPSQHPLSRAIAKLSPVVQPLSDWQEIRGSGVHGSWVETGKPPVVVQLGSVSWIGTLAKIPNAATAFVDEWTAKGATVLLLAAGSEVIGAFALRDVLKPGAPEVVAQLHEQNINVYLLTGDNQRTALAIARQAGIADERVFAEVKPEGKAAQIQQLQQQKGERIAFIGDGINDAPALKQADLGIAVSQACDVARDAADIVLLKSDIQAVPEALQMARATLRIIKQNLFWAFFYNAAAIPLAATGFLSPVLCAAAMGLSDIIVIGNALRLQRMRFSKYT